MELEIAIASRMKQLRRMTGDSHSPFSGIRVNR